MRECFIFSAVNGFILFFFFFGGGEGGTNMPAG